MKPETKNLVFVILAIIGGIVVLGWALKIAFKLVGIAIVLGLAVLAYIFIQNMVGKGR
ncbi:MULTISPECIES: hypothetical protein [Sphingomonas]|uniref:Uncharacterized protein n=1 Tax=Sphingomonas leidyi TaxID=68569 RepID=A0A7X5UYF8_9SPHN|nr:MULTISPECIES: hypothetical protein [Sphingomonas]MBN8810727.1 hypothetical protein [Sphingomonas sp.]MDF2382270.1 hypothetical protein [Nostoc ellipsosporum NOK]NIJ64533.1 hypothetical protein [Sphingomonas leidyi]HWU95179.1 hypothetical protein [Sphingomonas sp.]